jgi:hypothetical protein
MSNINRTQTPPPPTAFELERETASIADHAYRQQRAKSHISLRRSADLAIIIGWIAAGIGILAGIGLIIQTDDSGFATTHPYIGAGIAAILGSILMGAVVNLLGSWALAWSLEESR